MNYTVTKEVKRVSTVKREVRVDEMTGGFAIYLDGDLILACHEDEGSAYVYQFFYRYFPKLEDNNGTMRGGVK